MFRVTDGTHVAEYQLTYKAGASYQQTTGSDVMVLRGKKEKRLLDVFLEDPACLLCGWRHAGRVRNVRTGA